MSEINKDTIISGTNKTLEQVAENADQVIVSDTEPTSADNELWVDTSSNATYINQEVQIGTTNPSNIRTWFKKSKNLFNKNNVSKLNAYFNVSTPTITSSDFNRTLYIPCNENTTYTITIPDGTGAYAIGYTTTTPTIGTSVSGVSNTNKTITTGANAKYLVIRYFQTNNATITEQEALNGIQIEEGSTATAYEDYIIPSIIADNTEFYSQAEIGENSNGKYIKYADGTMICTGVKSFTGANFTTQNGSVYIPATSPTINFAQQFIENPVVTLTAFNRANGVYESGLSTSLVAIWPFAFSSITNANYSIYYIAIGRWK